MLNKSIGIALCLLAVFANEVAIGSITKPLPPQPPLIGDVTSGEPESFLMPRTQTRAWDINLAYRLPNNTKPETYDISLTTKIHSGDFAFTGTVKIGILTLLESRNITLHKNSGLTIQSIKLWTTASTPVEVTVSPNEYDPNTELLVIPIPTALPTQTRYTLEIQYSGVLRDDEAGFYRSFYTNDAGQTVWLATTQFEQTDARHAFPCYDEPALKAKYTIRITHDGSYNAISNMQETRGVVNNVDGTVTTSFRETPLTSSYLIAFIVSDFKQLTNNNVTFEHRTFAQPNFIEQTRLALAAGEAILNGIANYLGVEFTLPKMDQAAIPQFAAGAMENWGLVTYREPAFFWDEATSRYNLKQSIYSIIAHEFGHQWFGNLISPKWWTYIWLNEGFANYFGNLGVHLVYPEMRMMDLYVVYNVHSMLNYDASGDTRPMTHYIEDPGSVSGVFDNIAYGKSGSVIRMFSHAFTEATFRKGLSNYFNAKALSDAAEEDLFAALQLSVTEDSILPASLTVSQIMLTWTRQSGYPVLHVTHYEDGVIGVRQERYLNNAEASVPPQTWIIPYNFVTGNDTNVQGTRPDGWLTQTTTNFTSGTARTWNADDWIVFNKEQTGFYRVLYDEVNHQRIADALLEDRNIVPTLSRAQLIDDSNVFVTSGRRKYSSLLSIARFLINETDYAPWHPFINPLNLLNQRLAGTNAYRMFEEFVGDLVTNLFEHVGVDDIANEPHLNKYSRSLAVQWACAKGVPECLERASNRLNVLINEGREFHQNIENQLLCASLRNATQPQFLFVWRRLLQTESQATRNNLLAALACTQSDDLLQRYIGSALNSTSDMIGFYQTGEVIQVVTNTYQSGIKGLELTLQFLTDNADEVRATFTQTQLQNLVNGIAQRINTEELKTSFDELIASLGDGIVSTVPNQTIAANLAWHENNFEDIEEFLHKHFGHNAANGFGTSAIVILVVAAIQSFKYLF